MRISTSRGDYYTRPHTDKRIKRYNVTVNDIIRVIETGERTQATKHKWEYTGTYIPYNHELRIKIVVREKNRKTIMTIHPMGRA